MEKKKMSDNNKQNGIEFRAYNLSIYLQDLLVILLFFIILFFIITIYSPNNTFLKNAILSVFSVVYIIFVIIFILLYIFSYCIIRINNNEINFTNIIGSGRKLKLEDLKKIKNAGHSYQLYYFKDTYVSFNVMRKIDKELHKNFLLNNSYIKEKVILDLD